MAALPSGEVLVAGGGASQPQMDSPVLAATRLIDPRSGASTTAPKMPSAATMATAVPLEDGSVLVLGGHAERYWTGPPPLTTAIRFVPER